MNKVITKKMRVDGGYWIFQSKEIRLPELQKQVDAPLLHWCRVHYFCCKSCISKQTKRQGNVYNQKPAFNINYDTDKVRIEQIREIQTKFTANEKTV